jgi:uncharacterized protein
MNRKTALTKNFYQELEAFFRRRGPSLVAFSGGVDSALLAFSAYRALGDNMIAVLAKSPSLSNREHQHATGFAKRHRIPLRIIETKEMLKTGYLANEGKRCYYCKQALFEKITELQSELKNSHENSDWPIVYGVNQDDLGDYRPGLNAAREAKVCSPYLELGMGKQDIRKTCEHYGLSVASKPATPCLASRIPHGNQVDAKKLSQVEKAEDVLFGLGFGICRVRHHGDLARIEVPSQDIGWLMEHRQAIVQQLKDIGFSFISLDLQGFRSGSLNEVLNKKTSHD